MPENRARDHELLDLRPRRCRRSVGDGSTEPFWPLLRPEAERYNRDYDHQGAHMKVVTVRDFRDHASEMFRSDDVVLVTRDGTPAGFFLPWDTPELPVEVRREVFLRLSEQIGAGLKAKDVDEQEVLGDFAASRSHS
jgi:hypothetical protein